MAAAVAAAVVALHFLAVRRPRRAFFPTARFVPEGSVRAPARSMRPTDLVLLLMRVLAVLLLGAAFARPVWTPSRRDVIRVVALDISRSVRASAEGRDSAAAVLREGDLLVVFDSAARLVRGDLHDSLRTVQRTAAPGSLSAALIAAARAATTVRDRADSVELVIISPFAREEWDEATSRIRALWRGRARLVRVAAADSAEWRGAIDVRAPADDPLRATVALLGPGATASTVRVDRGAPERADTAWARSPGNVLVRWPARPPASWPRPARADTAGAVLAGRAVLVAPLPRDVDPPAARPIAWWVDGRPAATERMVGEGCVRDVAIAIPEAGDLALSESTRRLVRALVEPCGGAPALGPTSDSALAILRGDGPLADPRALHGRLAASDRITTWLLLAAALLVVAEPLARRARTEAT
jgi:hypothetical protein